jgi:hypothetical protein
MGKQELLGYVQRRIEVECDNLKAMLLEKNSNYGNSAVYPVRVFSKASPREQINVRMDDKLSRIANMGESVDESLEQTEFDLAGYIILKRVEQHMRDIEDQMSNLAAADAGGVI